MAFANALASLRGCRRMVRDEPGNGGRACLMTEGQNDIYDIYGENIEVVSLAVLLGMSCKKGLEVLYMVAMVD